MPFGGFMLVVVYFDQWLEFTALKDCSKYATVGLHFRLFLQKVGRPWFKHANVGLNKPLRHESQIILSFFTAILARFMHFIFKMHL